MAIDFRASQFRGAKFIASGSTGTGARIVFYDIANDNTSTPNQGDINTSTWDQSSIGSDVFLFVSGTVLSGTSNGRITAFGGSVKISGVLSIGTGSIYLSGSSIIFTNPPYNGSPYDPNNNGVVIANHNVADGSFISWFGQNRPINMTIRAASTEVSGAGGELALLAGSAGSRYGNGEMTGGPIRITAGQGGSQSEPGSDAGGGGGVSISAGGGGSIEDLGTPGAGGNLSLQSGNGGFALVNGNGGAGGNILVTAGNGGAGQTGFSGGDGGNVFITAGDPTSPGTPIGGSVTITGGGDVFGFTNCTPGNVNLVPGQNTLSGTIGKVFVYAETAPTAGRDEFFVVSGTISTGSSAKITSFRGSIRTSGSIGFGSLRSTYIQASGNDLKFYDAINPQGYSLSQLASSSGGGGSGGSLQQAYISGNIITLTSSVGPIRILGDQGSAQSASIHIVPTNNTERAIAVYDTTDSSELVVLHGLDSTGGGGGLAFKSRGDFPGYIGWSNQSDVQMNVGEGAMNASILWHDNSKRIKITERTTTEGRVAIWNLGTDTPSLEFQNVNPGFGVFFADAPTSILNNSGSLIQSGAATFNSGLSGSLTRLKDGSSYLRAGSNITITSTSNGAVTIAASVSGSGTATNQRVFMAGALTTVSTQSVGAGQLAFSGSDWSSTPVGVFLRGIANVTAPPHTASIRLFNLTSNQYINLGATQYLSVTASNPTHFVSNNIFSSLSSSNIFELRISSSLSASFVSLGSAELYVVF